MIWMANMTLVRVTSRVWSQPKLKDYDDPYDLPSIKHGWLRNLLHMAGLSGEHHLCIGLSCLSCLIARGQINPLRCPPDFAVHFMNWNSVNRKSCWSVLSNGMIGIIMNRLGYFREYRGVRSWAYHQPKNSSVCLKILMIHECFGTLFSEARSVPWCVVAAPPRVLWILGV
jgi:hypothetical protein